MKAYYFNSAYTESVLYIPKNLIVIENEEGDYFDIRYKPEEIKEFDWLWRNDKESLFNNPDNALIREIEVDGGLVRKFQDSCFDNNESSIICNALKIFKLTKKQVEGSCID